MFRFGVDELDKVCDVLVHARGDLARRQEYSSGCMDLPSWFNLDLDPLSPEYKEQQIALWREITQRDEYLPERDEMTPEVAQIDGVLRPGFYRSGDAVEAGDHLIAMGLILKCSGISPGSRILEYGAGFGQIALAFARLGAVVDTVDISPAFSAVINQLAERYAVKLRGHAGTFGKSPSEDTKYDLIYFYESFHHCLEFADLIVRLSEMITGTGRVILAGEPIAPDDSPIVPYPWGIRLDAPNVAIMRQRGWMELGFRRSYLARCFTQAGFVWETHDMRPSRFGPLYLFRKRPATIDLKTHQLNPEEEQGWFAPDPYGRWTRGTASLDVDATVSGTLELMLVNYHKQSLPVTVECGSESISMELAAGSRVALPVTHDRCGSLLIRSPTIVPVTYDVPDPRPLGVHVERVRYM